MTMQRIIVVSTVI